MTDEQDLALEALSAEHFQPLLGQSFSIQLPEGTELKAELAGVRGGSAGAPGGRAGFCLTFYCDQLPESQYLKQGTYTYTHTALGSLTLFTTPTAPDARGVRYEVIFG